MIQVDGVDLGTAAEVAAALTAPDSRVTPAMIRRWAERGKLPAQRAGRAVLFPLQFAALVELEMRGSARGRPRAA